MDFAAMNREQIALLVAVVGVFFVIPIGWLIHGVLKDKRDAAQPSSIGPKDLAKLRGSYPGADVSQLEGLTSHQTEAFAEAIQANNQVQILFAQKSPSE